MNWALETAEVLHWEGRPAPRCYTFRNWRHSLFGGVLLLVALWWQSIGLELAAAEGVRWLAWLPLPVLLAGGYLAVGHHLLARLEWPHVAYAVSDRRILLRRGLLRSCQRELPLADLRYVTLDRLGTSLVHVRLADSAGRWLTLCCLEHPERLLPLLEQAIRANTIVARSGGESI